MVIKRELQSSKKKENSYKANPIRLSVDVFSRNIAGHKGVVQYIESDERKNPATKNTLSSKVIFENKRKDKEFLR